VLGLFQVNLNASHVLLVPIVMEEVQLCAPQARIVLLRHHPLPRALQVFMEVMLDLQLLPVMVPARQGTIVILGQRVLRKSGARKDIIAPQAHILHAPQEPLLALLVRVHNFHSNVLLARTAQLVLLVQHNVPLEAIITHLAAQALPHA
jgi:hypothetical protein